MQIKNGEFVVIDVDVTDPSKTPGSKGKEKGQGGFSELENAPDEVETPDLDVTGKYGPGYERSLSGTLPNVSVKKVSSVPNIGKGGSEEEAAKAWKTALASAASSSSGGLSDKARKLLATIEETKPRVNWKKELREFMDQTLGAMEPSPYSRRFIGTGGYFYTDKPAGEDTLRTLVLPVDTSGSISNEQIKEFIKEVWHITKIFEVSTLYIVYTSDTIDAIDIVDNTDKNEKPDYSLIRSTGGNREGFIPPFKFIQNPMEYKGKVPKQKQSKLPKTIDPSVVIYFTDTHAKYPNINDFGIKNYANRVFWFICVPEGSQIEEPPKGLGKKLFVPINSGKRFS